MKTSKPKQPPSNSSSQYNYPHQFATAYGPKLKQSITFAPGFGRTKQSHAAECDINNIMARYLRTGVIDVANKHAPQYGDCSGWEFQAAITKLAEAKSMFAGLPAKLRNRFENDPGQFLDFVHDRENLAEMRELGLLKPEAPAATPLPTPPAEAARGASTDRAAVRKAAQVAGAKAAGEEPKDHLPT